MNSYLFFIKGLIAIISESGLKKLRELETRKQVEESEEHRRIILQTAMDGFWLADADGRLLEVNETYCRLSGYTAPELLTMRISDLEAGEATDATIRHIQKIIAQGEDRFESRHRRKDGSEFDVEVSAQYRPTNGGRFVAFLRDITERRRTQEVLETSVAKSHAIIDVSPVSIALNDEQQRITYLNPAFVATFGYTREDIPTLTQWWQAAYPDPEYRRWVAETWQAELEQAKRAGSAFSPIEVTVRCKDGAHKTVLAGAASISQAFQGEHVVVLYDITERVRTEAALRLTRFSIEHAADALFWMTPDARIVDVNEAACRSLGYTREELLRLRVPDVDAHYDAGLVRATAGELAGGGRVHHATPGP